MTKVLVLYYSLYGHTEILAQAVAEGVNRVNGAEVSLKRVPELMPLDIKKAAGGKMDSDHPVATVEELVDYDALILGSPTRFGSMCSQMRNFLDQTGSLWVRGALENKIASAFTCTSSGSGNEMTILSLYTTFIHHGMIVTGLSPLLPELKDQSHMHGGSIYGAASITGAGETARFPTETEKAFARHQGDRVATIAKRFNASGG